MAKICKNGRFTSSWGGTNSAVCIATLSSLVAGCAAPSSTDAQPIVSRAASFPSTAPNAPLQLVSHRAAQPEPEKAADSKGPNGQDKHEGLKEKITLPIAIQMCISQNFRLLAGEERVRQAEADLTTAALIPNASVYLDYQLIPLQAADINRQLGPPQADVLVTVPIDWLLFGKRLAGMHAARLGIDVASADQADLQRQQIARTVDTFYEVLADEEFLKLAEKNHEELKEIEKITEELARNNKAGSIELNTIKLAVQEAFLDIHERERNLAGAKARLRPLIGRSATDADFEVEGQLTVNAVVPAPKLPEVLALADAHRPDLVSDRHDIDRARANVEVERRRAYPQVSVVPGWSYQNQQNISGNPNGSLFDIGVSTTLPFTDRNQGNIRKARAREQEMQHTYRGDRADVLAEVEATLANYEDAVEDVTQNNSPATLKAALDLRKNIEAGFRGGDRKLPEVLLAHQAYRQRIAHIAEFESTYWRMLNKLNMVVGLNAYDQERGATLRVGKE